MIVYPDYYERFSCIAGECKHSCCKNWEIDIDPEAMARFTPHPEICSKIDHAPQAHFCMRPDGACPFLNANGLCDMIINYGEDMLCDICADHPRYRNWLSDRVEIGIGMCCEAAAHLIITNPDPVHLIYEHEDMPSPQLTEDESYVLDLRDRVLSILTDRTFCLNDRIRMIIEETECPLPEFSGKEIYTLLSDLEYLDPEWPSTLARLTERHFSALPVINDRDQTVYEQILVYFVLRHILPAAEDDALYARVRLCLLLWQIAVHLISAAEPFDTDHAVEMCRLISSEIEYSDENLQCLIEALE